MALATWSSPCSRPTISRTASDSTRTRGNSGLGRCQRSSHLSRIRWPEMVGRFALRKLQPITESPETGLSFARIRFEPLSATRDGKIVEKLPAQPRTLIVAGRAPARTHRLRSMATPRAPDYTNVGRKESLLEGNTQ